MKEYFGKHRPALPVIHVRSSLNNGHFCCKCRMCFSDIVHGSCFAIKVIVRSIFALAPFRSITKSRDHELVKTINGSCGVGNILPLLEFQFVAVLVDGLAFLEKFLRRRVVEGSPEIRRRKDRVCAFEGGNERSSIIEITLHDLHALIFPGLGLLWVAGDSSNLPSVILGINLGD